MVRFTHVIWILVSLLAMGCNSNHTDSKRPYLMQSKSSHTPVSASLSKREEKIALTAMEAAHQEKLATIAAQKEMTLKKLEVEQRKASEQAREKIAASENQRQILIEQERQKAAILIEKEKQQTATILQKENATLYRQYLIAGIALFMMLMLFIYAIHHRNQKLKLKLHEEELRHRAYMQASKQHHERVNKTLEILANENTDKNLKKELVKLLKDQGGEQPKLLN